MNERLAAARLWLYRCRLFVGVMLWSLTPVESREVRGLGVDAGNPEFCRWAEIELLGVWLCHLVMHLAADHPERGTALGTEPARRNLAADLAVNSALDREWVGLPADWALPWQLGLPPGLTAVAAGGLWGGGSGAAGSGGSAGARKVPGWWRRWATAAGRRSGRRWPRRRGPGTFRTRRSPGGRVGSQT
jgi:hypothetical protein